MQETCLPCLQQSQRFVGSPGLYGLRGDAPVVAAPSTYDLKRDATAAITAFSLPALYHYKAPKKWKRPGKLGAVAAVVVLYFTTSYIYGRITAA